jgi:hypothetical protein
MIAHTPEDLLQGQGGDGLVGWQLGSMDAAWEQSWDSQGEGLAIIIKGVREVARKLKPREGAPIPGR